MAVALATVARVAVAVAAMVAAAEAAELVAVVVEVAVEVAVVKSHSLQQSPQYSRRHLCAPSAPTVVLEGRRRGAEFRLGALAGCSGVKRALALKGKSQEAHLPSVQIAQSGRVTHRC